MTLRSNAVELVQGDTGPDLYLHLTSDGDIVDLTNMATALLKYRPLGGSLLTSATLTVVAPATGGVLKLVPTVAMTADVGYFEGEVEMTMIGGQIITGFKLIPFYVRAQVQ